MNQAIAWLVGNNIQNLQALSWTEHELESYASASRNEPLPLRKLCLVDSWETDHSLLQLVLASPNLTSLQLSSNSRVTDALLPILHDARVNLKELVMRHIVLTEIPLPSTLTYLACQFTNGKSMQSFENLTELRRLELVSDEVGGVLNAKLHHLTGLTTLTLVNVESLVQKLPVSLTELRFKGAFGLSDKDLKSLNNLTKLHTLVLDGCLRLTNCGMKHLGTLPLKVLSLDSCCNITLSGIEFLKNCPIEEIDITGTGVSVSEVSYVFMGWQIGGGIDKKLLRRPKYEQRRS